MRQYCARLGGCSPAYLGEDAVLLTLKTLQYCAPGIGRSTAHAEEATVLRTQKRLQYCAPGSTRAKDASVVIYSTLVIERGDKEFSVTGFFNLGSIKSLFHQT